MYKPRVYGSEAATGPNAIWETAYPDWWVPKGYAMVRVDTRGAFKSPGRRDFMSRKDQEDYYDMIEWCGTPAAVNDPKVCRPRRRNLGRELRSTDIHIR